MRNTILAIDVGNTTTQFGLFVSGKLALRMRTVTLNRTGDELFLMFRGYCHSRGARLEPGGDCVMCSVVPPLTAGFVEMAAQLFGKEPLVVDSSVDTGLKIQYKDPGAVGADRIATAVGAMEKFGKPLVVVDAGTATTFDVIDRRGRYLGGAIAPGVSTAAEELFRRGAKLSRVELKRPDSVIGKSTEESLQSGIVFGAAAQVDGILTRIFEELGYRPLVVATGGYAPLIAPLSSQISRVEDTLVLDGLLAIYRRNRRAGREVGRPAKRGTGRRVKRGT
ncbi:MAG: type III pantothenate kinase [Candidatus Eisenbacteria bacterium]